MHLGHEHPDFRRRHFPVVVPMLAAAVLGLGLLAAGCGSGSGSPGVAALDTTTAATTTTDPTADGAPSTATSKAAAGAKFSACMRSHGVPNFPDPSSGGGLVINPGSGINPNSPQFQAAQRACAKELPNGGKAPTPAQQAKMQAQALRFSACMRSHGVPEFPDPDFSAGAVGIKIGKGSGINPSSPQFQSAQKACEQYLPGLKRGPGPRTGVQEPDGSGGESSEATSEGGSAGAP